MSEWYDDKKDTKPFAFLLEKNWFTICNFFAIPLFLIAREKGWFIFFDIDNLLLYWAWHYLCSFTVIFGILLYVHLPADDAIYFAMPFSDLNFILGKSSGVPFFSKRNPIYSAVRIFWYLYCWFASIFCLPYMWVLFVLFVGNTGLFSDLE